MAEQDNEQAGEALLQNARRTLREQPRRAIAGLCVVLLLGLLTAALASSLQRVSADDVCADAVAGAVKPMALSGSYAVDGGEERPYAARQALDAKGIGVEAVTVRGTLENDVAAGELVNMRLSSTACTVRVNGETVFSFDGIGDSEPAGEPLLGWIGFRSPGISTRDEVEIALSSAASYSVLGDYVIVLDSLCTGEPGALFVASVASHLPMFVSGILVLIAGLILLLIASVGYLIGVPKETGGLRFAFYVLIGGVWIFFCFDYITLLIPFPAFTTTVSLLAQDVLALLQLSFIASRATGYPRRLATLLLAALSLMLGVCIVLRLAGVASLYEANVVIIPLFVIGVFFAALALAVEARESRDQMAVDATLVVIPCTIGSVVEGLSFLFGGVTTGLWLCAGILCAVVVRFVALFSYARSQIVQAERAHRMEAELLQSRIAVMLSQIQPHFLFNALNTIEYLCEEDPPVAARATNDFARYLRGNMDSLMGSQMVSFRNELEHLAHYVAIEQLRYPSIKVGVRRARGRFSRAVVKRAAAGGERHQARRFPAGWRGRREGFVVARGAVVRRARDRQRPRIRRALDRAVQGGRRRRHTRQSAAGRSARAQPCRTGERRGPRRRDLRRHDARGERSGRRRQRDDDGSMRGRGRFAMIKPIVVDDERIALESLAKKLARIDGVEAPELFETAAEACAFLEGAAADIAFLDISLRDSDGLELAERVRELCPGCAVVFVTGYADYAVDAFRIHADGYVLKPVSVEDLEREIAHARERRAPAERALVRVQTFGGFEVYAGDVPVHFKRSKSKELFAFLVDRRGAGASNVQIARALWDNVYYDVSHQKMLQTIIADMMKALREVGAEQTVVRRRNHLSVRSSMIECDYYRLLEGDSALKGVPLGPYLPDYAWASKTAAALERAR